MMNLQFDLQCKTEDFGVAVYSVPDSILLKTNQKYLDSFESPFNQKNKCIGSDIAEINPRWKNELLQRKWQEAIISQTVVTITEYEGINTTGVITYWDAILTPILEEGHVKYILCNIFDVTERVGYRKQIEEENKRLKQPYNNQMDINNLPMLRDFNGERQIVIQTNRDITNYKLLSEQLQHEKHHIEAILDNMTEGLIVIDVMGNLITLNAAALRMSGISASQDYKHLRDFENIFELRSLDGKVVAMEWSLDKEAFSDYEIWICHKDKDYKWIGSFSGTPIYNRSGKLVMQIVTFSDITLRKNKQEYLVKIEREKKEALEASIKLKDEFLYLITHEFKTPLAVMSSALQTMDLIYKDNIPQKAKKYLNTIKQNINRQIRLVNNLLDITRINSGSINLNYGNYDIVYLTKSIVNSIQPIAYQKGIIVNFSASMSKKEIAIDEEKMERILLNLLSNALKFTPSNRSIHINLTTKKNKNKNMVYISIQDEGIGIPKDKQSYIFERFGQVNTNLSRQAEGTGIGLHLVKLFVHVLGGDITLESQEGKGSIFTIKIPATKVKKIQDDPNLNEDKLLLQGEGRLIQTAEIELSDIYI